MDVEAVEVEQTEPGSGAPEGNAVAKWTVVAYSAFLALLVPVFLWVGRGGWFQHDDWDYLVLRKVGNAGDLVRPHSGHWETVPVVVYRVLWSMFGLRYRPYQLVSIVASLVGAALLLAVLLRVRVRPWLAVLTVTLLVFFGDAQANVALRVTSITFVGFAMPLGLLQILLADHDGSRDRRDWLGLAAGLVAVLCSGVAVAMVFVVGVTVLVKRGRRMALFHALPPAILFSAWYLSIGRTDTAAGDPARLHPLPQAVHFAWLLLTGTLESLTRLNGIGVLLLAALLIGLVLAVRSSSAEHRRDAVIPCVMLLGAGFFAVETGLGRADLLKLGDTAVRAGHYMDVVGYLALPAVAFVGETLVRRWRLVIPALVAGFLVLIPLNAHAFVVRAHASEPRQRAFRNAVLLIPALPLAHEVPRSVRPFNGTASPVTVGWLLDTARAHKMPVRRHISVASRAVATVRISMVVGGTPPTPCRPFRGAVVRHLGTRRALKFRGAAIRVSDAGAGAVVPSVLFTTSGRRAEWRITNVGRPLTLRFEPVSHRFLPPMLCN